MYRKVFIFQFCLHIRCKFEFAPGNAQTIILKGGKEVANSSAAMGDPFPDLPEAVLVQAEACQLLLQRPPPSRTEKKTIVVWKSALSQWKTTPFVEIAKADCAL